MAAVLQDELTLSAESLAELLGRLLDCRVLGSREVSALTPAFDLIDYADAVQRGCLAFREDSEVSLLLADPFDDDLQAWCVPQGECLTACAVQYQERNRHLQPAQAAQQKRPGAARGHRT